MSQNLRPPPLHISSPIQKENNAPPSRHLPYGILPPTTNKTKQNKISTRYISNLYPLLILNNPHLLQRRTMPLILPLHQSSRLIPERLLPCQRGLHHSKQNEKKPATISLPLPPKVSQVTTAERTIQRLPLPPKIIVLAIKADTAWKGGTPFLWRKNPPLPPSTKYIQGE